MNVIDIKNKSIIIGSGDIIFEADPLGNVIVRQIDPPEIPGTFVGINHSIDRAVASTTIDYNKNFLDLRTECKRLMETRETGDDMTRYFAGPPLMLGNWEIKFNDTTFNLDSTRVLVVVLKYAINNYYSLDRKSVV